MTTTTTDTVPDPPATVAEPAPRASTRSASWRVAWFVASVGLLALVVVASIAVGARSVPFLDAAQALVAPDGSLDHAVIREIRLPRTEAGILVGVAMGLAGALIQAITRNPLADPGILGVNAGAGFALILAVAVFGLTTPLAYVWFSFAGAVVATVLVYTLGSIGRGGATPERFAVAGVALGSVLGGFGTVVEFIDQSTFRELSRWRVGSIADPLESVLVQLAPFLAVGVVLAMVLARPLNAVAMGDDVARALGAELTRVRVGSVIAVTLLAGSGTAIGGPVAFVGFVVPHVARRICGPDQRWVFAYTLVLAPALVLVADIVGRVVVRPSELPVGVVTAFVGAPLLIFIVRRRRTVQL